MSKIVGLMMAAAVFCGGAMIPRLPGGTMCRAAEIYQWPSTRATNDPQWIMQKLYQIHGKTLVLHDIFFHEDEWAQPGLAVATDENTTFSIDYERASLSDLQTGLDVTCMAWRQPSGPPKLFVNEQLPSVGGRILKIEGNTIICPVNLYWIDHQAVNVVFDDKTKVFYWPDQMKPELPVLKTAAISDLKAGMVIQAVPETGTAQKIYIYDVNDTNSPDMSEMKSIASLPARQFNSKLSLQVYLAPQKGMFSALDKPLGVTPSEVPLAIPAGRMWCVTPGKDVDREQLDNEINAQNIPGLAITDLPANSDLTALEKLPNLRYLRLSGPGGTDAQLAHLAGMKKLEDLYLQSDANVTDAGLKNLEPLESLLQLDLSGTQITGATFREFDPLSLLVMLNLDDCPIDDAGLQQVEGSSSMRRLSLAHTKLTDVGMQWLLGLTQMEQLDLSNTQVSDAGLGYLEGMLYLQSLDLAHTKVTSAGMEYLQEMTALQTFDISNTQVGDAGLQYVKLMTKLQKLDLSNSKVTPRGAAAMKQALPNCEVGDWGIAGNLRLKLTGARYPAPDGN